MTPTEEIGYAAIIYHRACKRYEQLARDDDDYDAASLTANYAGLDMDFLIEQYLETLKLDDTVHTPHP